MRPLARSSLKTASHVGCRIVLWLLVVLPAVVVAARTVADVHDHPLMVVPRVMFMVAVALLTVRFLGHYFKAGNILYVCFETSVAIVACYTALAVIWANVEALAYLLLNMYSYLLEKIWGIGMDESKVQILLFFITTKLAAGFLLWAVSTTVDLNGPEYSVRFSSVVEVRFIVSQSHRPEHATSEKINAPEGPGRNPVVTPGGGGGPDGSGESNTTLTSGLGSDVSSSHS